MALTTKRSLWTIFRKKTPKCANSKKEEPKTKHEDDCENMKIPSEQQIQSDIGYISQKEGGKVYKTCGSAYILQKEHVIQDCKPESPESKILDEMIKDPSLKGIVDPMPPFESVERRLIDLSERKLHPLYKWLMSIPKRPTGKIPKPQGQYKTRSGRILPEEVPDHLKIDKEMFERKNLMYEFKRAEPPQQLIATLAEMKQNEKPTMEHKKEGNTNNCK